jgi:hypothetical protein
MGLEMTEAQRVRGLVDEIARRLVDDGETVEAAGREAEACRTTACMLARYLDRGVAERLAEWLSIIDLGMTPSPAPGESGRGWASES